MEGYLSRKLTTIVAVGLLVQGILLGYTIILKYHRYLLNCWEMKGYLTSVNNFNIQIEI